MLSFILSMCFSYLCFAQEQKITQREFDSIVAPHSVFWKDYFEYWRKYKEYGPHPEKIKELLTQNPALEGWHIYYMRKVHFEVFEKKYKRDSILSYIQKGMDWYEKKEIPSTRGDNAYALMIYYERSRLERDLHRAHDESMKYGIKALEFAETHNINSWIGTINYNIARNHYNMGNDSIALHYFQKSAEDTIHMVYDRPYIAVYSLMGIISYNLGKQELAKTYTYDALEVSEKGDYKRNIYPLLGLMAQIYKKEQEIDSMEHYYRRAIDWYENFYQYQPYYRKKGSENTHNIYVAYFDIQEGNLKETIPNLKKIVDEYMAFENLAEVDRVNFIAAINLLGKAYEKQGNASEYSHLLEDTQTFLAKFEEQQLKQNLENLEVEYQTKEKEISIAQLEKNKIQQDEIIGQQRIITTSLIALLILFTVIALLVARQRKLKNQFEKRDLEQRLLRTQLNPHFIFNSLSLIQKTVEKDPQSAKEHITKFSRLLVSIFENSSLNYISLQKEIEAITQYMDLQRMRFNKNFSYQIQQADFELDTLFVPSMLLQPVIENSLLHGFSNIDYPGEISITFKKEKSFIICTVEDNGKGLDENRKESNKTSSTKLIKDFIDKMEGSTYKITNKWDALGTKAGVITTFSLPYKINLHD